MGKYSKSTVLQAAIDAHNEQKRLKQKHNIKDDNVVVVEKSSIWKVIIMTIKTVFSIILFCCAAIGIFALLYNDTREIIFDVVKEIINSIF